MADSALLTDDDVFGGPALLTDDDIFGRPAADLIPASEPGVDPNAGRVTTAVSQFGRGVADTAAGIPQAVAIGEAQGNRDVLAEFDKIDAGTKVSDLMSGRPPESPPSRLRAGAESLGSVPMGALNDVARYREADAEGRAALRQKYATTDPRQSPAYRAGQWISDTVKEALPVNPEHAQEFLAGTVPQALGSATGFLAFGVGGAAMRAPAFAAPAIAGSGLQATQQFQDAIDNGASIADAFKAANLGAIVGTSEAIPIGHLLDRLDKGTGGSIKRLLIEAAKQGTEEALQEVGQTIAANLIASDLVAYDPERGVFTTAGEQGAAGFTVGALMQTVAGLVLPGGRHAGVQPPPAPESAPPGQEPPEERARPTEPLAPKRMAPVTPDDEASPLPTDTISRGKAIMDDAAAGRPLDVAGQGATAATPVETPDSKPVPVETPLAKGEAIRINDPGGALDGATGTVVETGENAVTVESNGQRFRVGKNLIERATAPATENPSAEPAPAPARSAETQSAATERPGPEWKPLYGDADLTQQIGWSNPATGEERMFEAPQPEGQAGAEQAAAAPTVPPVADQAPPAAVAAVAPERAAATDAAAAEAAPAPTDAQKEAGNYKKGHTKFAGLDISIENARGSERTGTSPDGEQWSVTMPAHYGYIKRTEGADGDHVDVYLGDGPEDSPVVVVDQVNADTGKFDEHKVLLGYPDAQAALEAYRSGFSDGRGDQRIGAYRIMPVEDFKTWLRDGDQTKPAAADTAPRSDARQPIARRDIETDTAVTSAGREVPVRYAVVEAADLVPSQTDDGRANPAYPQEMQPRDRGRATSRAQINDIAQNLNPRLLDRSPRASDGAPIVAADGVVESGNGRVLALRQAYRQGGAAAYRDYLAAQGYPVDGMTAPVLVRVRESEMSPADRQAFTREANERDTLAMSATERAMADASAMPPAMLDLYRGGEIDAAGNRDFVRRFVGEIASATDRAGMVAADGSISQEAKRRIEAALLAKAYGDAALVADLVESADSNVRAIGGAMMDVAGVWAGMRADAAAGRIDPSMDQTEALLEAVKLVQRARRDGRSLAEYVGQTDMLSGRSISPVGELFLRLFYRNKQSWTQPAGREKVSEALRFYVTEAGKTAPGIDLLGQAAVPPGDIIGTAEERQYGRTQEQEEQGNLLAQPARGPGERARPDGGVRAEPDQQGRRPADGQEGARAGGEGAGGREVAAGRRTAAYDLPDEPPPRSRGIPEAAADPISTFKSDADIKAHPDYRAAKGGDVRAAERLVRDLVPARDIREAGRRFGADAVYLPVLAEEASGRNKIPLAVAARYAGETSAEFTTDVLQSSRSYHTGAKPLGRLIARPVFEGPIEAGRRYVLVDDVTVMGGTLAELADYVQAEGGEVVGVVTLVNAGRSGHLRVPPLRARMIERRYGDAIRDEFGVDPAALTADEATYILGFRDADGLRSAVARARDDRGRRLSAKGLREDGDEGGLTDAAPAVRRPLSATETSARADAFTDGVYGAPTADGEKARAAVERLLARIAPGAGVRTPDRLVDPETGRDRAYGLYIDGVIHVALAGPSAQRTARHEAIHYLRQSGLISDANWRALEKAARDGDWIGKYRIRERYARQGLTGAQMIEEAIAEGYAEWAAGGRKAQNRLLMALKALKRFFDQVRAAVRRAVGREADFRDLFSDVETGRVGGAEAEGRSTGSEFADMLLRGVSRLLPAYHGSPHDFDRFSLSKIGTGEGAQAYGWGLYFASRKEIAEHYKNALARSGDVYLRGEKLEDQSGFLAQSLNSIATDMRDGDAFSKAKALELKSLSERAALSRKIDREDVAQKIDQAASDLRAIEQDDFSVKRGRLYEVELSPEPEHLLDWDKNMSKQSRYVRDRLKRMQVDDERGFIFLGDPTGEEIYAAIAARLADVAEPADPSGTPAGWGGFRQTVNDRYSNQRAASLTLLETGIPGIRYSDASRNKWTAKGGLGRWIVSGPNGYTANFTTAAEARAHIADKADHNYVIFDENAVEVRAKYDLPDLTETDRRTAARMTPQDRALIDKHLAPPQAGRISRLAKAAFVRDRSWSQIGDDLVTALVNQLNPIFAYEMRAEEAAGRKPAIRDASASAAKMAEFTMNDTGRTWAMFHAGPLRYNAAEGIVEADESGKGLFDIFKYLSDPDTYDKFRLYAAARRGDRLMKEGRERNLTQAAIDRGLAMADERGTHQGEARTFRQIFDDYQAFNRALLQGMGVETGLLSQEDVDLFTQHMDYTPFYRQADETAEPLSGPWLRKNINKPDPGIKKLEGGGEKIADLMENIARNAQAITRAGMRNVTMRRIYELAEVLGEGQIVREGSADDGVLTYRVNGRDVKFTVDDPALVAAVAAMRPEQHSGLYKALINVTAFFRNGITASPAFMLRNLVRGSVAGFVQTGRNVSLANNALTGMVRALRNDRSIREMKAISGTGAYTFGGAAGDLGAMARRKIGAQRDAMPVAVVRKTWEALEKFGEATELADRDAIYRNMIRGGSSRAEAAYQAMNLINYSRRGSSKSLRVLLPLVPFLNARIQGLYRMAETQAAGADKVKALAGVAVRGLVLTAISLALREWTKDDDRYDDEPLYRKLNYYIVYAGDSRILIPKAFEFGALFSTVPELVMDAIEQGEGARLAEGLTQTLLVTFAFNPIPQPALPILENIANYSFFTGRQLENQRLQNMRPGDRYTAATPQVLRAIGREANISPVQMENLVRGYTGTMGMSFLAALDSIGRFAGLFPSEPTGPFGDYGIFSDFMTDQLGSMYKVGPDRANRWVGDLYDMSRQVNQSWRYAKSLAADGDMDAAEAEVEESGAGARKFINKRVRALGTVNKLIRQVEDDPSMTALQKRAELNRLYGIRNKAAEETVKAVKGATGL